VHSLFAQGSGNLSSTNLEMTHNFWNAVESSNGPVTVLAFGDSVSESWRSLQLFLFARLQSQFGVAGYTLDDYSGTTDWQPSNGTTISDPSTNWWTGHGLLPPGGFLFWSNQNDPSGSLVCDRVGVFWIAQPGGGAFTLSVSTNGDYWSDALLTLDGYSPAPVGRYASAALDRQPYRLRVDGVSGTNIILGPQYLDTTSSGINVAFMTQDGANLDQIFSLSTNVLYPILSALNPQLVVWHMKELADIGATDLSNRLYDLEALWQAGVTNGDVVYVGTPYEVNDLTQVFTPIQNGLVRQAALRDQRAYLDCMTPCVSYQSMTNNGYLDTDGLHPNNLCYSFLEGIAWEQLGFYALGVDRQLTINQADTGVRLQWATVPNVTYQLQSSTNLVDWVSLGSFAGDGQSQAYTNPISASSSVFFRLSLE
jgi:hypothetical protein